MKLFKNYKKLYGIELNNRKLYELRYKQVYDSNVEYQKEIKRLKIELAKVKIQLEDTEGFLRQEKQLTNALRERATRRSKTTNIKKKEEVKTNGKKD